LRILRAGTIKVHYFSFDYIGLPCDVENAKLTLLAGVNSNPLKVALVRDIDEDQYQYASSYETAVSVKANDTYKMCFSTDFCNAWIQNINIVFEFTPD
jgi:hypothetical protein